jgi:transcriptional regulator with XRE-family HTH domain
MYGAVMTSEAIAPEETMADALARRVRGLMGEQRMTARELAARLGLSQASMSRRLSGDMEFGLNEVPMVAQALGTSEAYLLGFAAERVAFTPTPGYFLNADDDDLDSYADVIPFRRRRAA